MSHSPPTTRPATTTGQTELLVVEAEDRPALLQSIDRLLAFLGGPGAGTPLADLAYTLQPQTPSAGRRLAVVASSLEDLSQRLDRALERLADDRCTSIRDGSGIYYEQSPALSQGKVAWLFPGEGSQYLGMLAGLAERFPLVAEVFENCDRDAAHHLPDGKPVSRFFAEPPPRDSAQYAALQQQMRRLDNAMFSVFMANWALFAVLETLRLAPDAVAGHSGGELAALVAAGVFDPEENLSLLGGAMETLIGKEEGDDALLAVATSADVLANLIEEAIPPSNPRAVSVAMDNCPHQSVAVGEAAAIGRLEEAARRRSLFCERLDLGRPYHTERFRPYVATLERLFENVTFRPPRLPIYSCSTGEPFPADPEAMRRLAVSHWQRPVEFTRLIKNLYRDGVRVFLEVGPRNNLTSFVDDILRDAPHLAIASNMPRRPATVQLLHMAGQLAAQQAAICLDPFYAGRSVQRVVWQQPPTSAYKSSRLKRSGTRRRRRRGGVARQGQQAVATRHLANAEKFLDVQREVWTTFFRHAQTASIASPRSEGPTPPADASRPQLYPMLGEVVAHRRGDSLTMRRRLDHAVDVYAAHHTVGGRSISRVDPDQHGLAIMPMTFTLEMMMESAAALFPELVVLGVKRVRLSRWLAFYESDPASVEVTARVVAEPDPTEFSGAQEEVLVEVRDRGRASEATDEPGPLAAVGTVVLGGAYPAPPRKPACPWSNERAATVDVATTYDNLFHGRLFRGYLGVERLGDEGIEGKVRALPRNELFSHDADPPLVGDPVLLDVAMHPAVTWHLEQPDQAGRIMLPFELDRLELYGPTPAPNARFLSRTHVLEETHWNYTHTTEVYDSSDRLWARIDRIKLWRFYLPFHDVNFHGPKDVYFLCDRWPEAMPPETSTAGGNACCVVRLKELSDLKQPALQLAGARVMLSPVELDEYLHLQRPDDKKAEWLFGRAAAKDAVRFLLRDVAGERPFMADVEITTDAYGRPLCRPRAGNQQTVAGPVEYPYVSIAHTAGHIAAIAAQTPTVGIDLERVVPRDESFLQLAFDEEEQRMLADMDDRDEWVARFWCAKEAVGKGLGRGLPSGPRSVSIGQADPRSGTIGVTLGPALAELFPDYAGGRLEVHTIRDGDLVAGSTLCQPVAQETLKN